MNCNLITDNNELMNTTQSRLVYHNNTNIIVSQPENRQVNVLHVTSQHTIS